MNYDLILKKNIIPAIKFLKKTTNISGPYSADTIFLNKKKFDVIVGMYHDQILPQFKALYNFDAINLTFGLKIFAWISRSWNS